jgi:hypothetical protein
VKALVPPGAVGRRPLAKDSKRILKKYSGFYLLFTSALLL